MFIYLYIFSHFDVLYFISDWPQIQFVCFVFGTKIFSEASTYCHKICKNGLKDHHIITLRAAFYTKITFFSYFSIIYLYTLFYKHNLQSYFLNYFYSEVVNCINMIVLILNSILNICLLGFYFRIDNYKGCFTTLKVSLGLALSLTTVKDFK